MKVEITKKNGVKRKDSEKGAAMVMVLLISSLMLTASIGLLLETSLNSANVTDATAEQQAYNAAESGIQSALNVLRGNSKYQKDTGEMIDFRKAVRSSTSNADGDTSTDARLSRWINYDTTYNDRVPFGLNGTTSYAPRTGYAYGLTIVDPENLGNIITFNTSGTINDDTSIYETGTGSNYIKIEYLPRASNIVNATTGPASAELGSFKITKGSSAVLPADIRFEIAVNMTVPEVTGAMRGFIRKGTSSTSPVASYDFDSLEYIMRGSTVRLSEQTKSPSVFDSLGVSATTITGTMTATEPNRVMITSTGYGPRGAVKKLEAFVQKNFLDGLGAPATLTLIGPAGPGFVFQPGNSARVTYSGRDIASPNVIIPPVGTSDVLKQNPTKLRDNYDKVKVALDALEKQPGQVVGEPADVTKEMPSWLKSPLNLDTVIQNLRDVAIASKGYYTSGQTPNNFGDYVKATGITFVDGDTSINVNGGGILVCTGTLTFNGGSNFNGLIIVTGQGGFYRSGGGGGTIKGNAVVAPYDPNNLSAGFYSPKYGISGGGNSEITYNSNSVGNGLIAVSNFALGVAEK